MINPYKDCQQTTVDRLLQNAYVRQLEILLLADQQAQAFKRKFIQEARAKINEQQEFKLKKTQSDFRVARSSLINHHRMRRIKGKYELCQKIFQQVAKKLHKITCEPQNKSSYSIFLISSITQGLVRMFEPNIYVRCLDRDKSLIKQLLSDITQTYNDFMIQQVGREYPIKIHISENCPLKERNQAQKGTSHQKNRQDSECIGGVILADESGNITLKSTLDCRINILKEICLPMVREMIWKKAKIDQ